jgi:cell wall-associated NlpC family hydrolase
MPSACLRTGACTDQEAAVRRKTIRNTMYSLAGAFGGTAVLLGSLALANPAHTSDAAAAQASSPRVVAASTTVDRAAAVRDVHARLTELERQADAAGTAAQQADEAVLRHDTAKNRAAASAAEAALASLADRQTPELAKLADRLDGLGVATAPSSTGATITTSALVGRTKALKAVNFAEKQVGDPYVFAKAGPGAWDCSGLTMGAYKAVSVGIGGHSSTAQWRKAKNEHRLHLYKHRKAGDLIFYGKPGNVYHVAMYVGGNKMVEAPYPGKKVRVVPVRSGDRLPNVGRPA